MAQSLAAIPAGPARNAGVSVGRKVADGILNWRANDGSAASVPYVPGTAPGQWRPTPPDYTVAWGPEWRNVKPFAIASPAAYLPPPPPALTSSAYAAALNQVESLGALNSTTRTADQTQAALFWSYDFPATGTPPVHYDQIVEDVALQQHNTLAQNARLFGLVNVAQGDAGIVAWNAKYTYNFWRPVTAIRLADSDGNPATIADPSWTPLGAPGATGQPTYTPPFPAYVSGHATFGSAVFTILADFYGTDNIHFTASSDQLPGVSRSFNSFSAASQENAWSRIYLGLHFWPDEAAGLSMGAAVGKQHLPPDDGTCRAWPMSASRAHRERGRGLGIEFPGHDSRFRARLPAHHTQPLLHPLPRSVLAPPRPASRTPGSSSRRSSSIVARAAV